MNIKRALAKQLLKKVKPSPVAFTQAGFTQVGNDFHFGTLIIFDGSYYYDMEANRVTVKNMQEVSDLIYGHTPFLDMSHG